MCEQYPDKVNKLIMLGASYKSADEKTVTSLLKKNLHDLAAEHERTLELTVSAMLESVDQPDRLKKVVKESHNNSFADSTAIDALFSDKNQVKAMQHRFAAFSVIDCAGSENTGSERLDTITAYSIRIRNSFYTWQ